MLDYYSFGLNVFFFFFIFYNLALYANIYQNREDMHYDFVCQKRYLFLLCRYTLETMILLYQELNLVC